MLRSNYLLWTFFSVLILSQFSIPVLKAQGFKSISVKLKKDTNLYNKRKLVFPARALTSGILLSKFRGIPRQINHLRFYAVDMQYKQSAFQRYKSGELDSISYNSIKNSFNIDEGKLSNSNIDQQVNILSGINDDQKIIICDINNNNDFSDDKINIYSLAKLKEQSSTENLNNYNISYEYFTEGKTLKRNSYVKIIPYSKNYTYKDSISQLLAIHIQLGERMFGKVRIGDDTYTIYLPFTTNKGGDYSSAKVVFSDSLDSNELPIDPLPRIGELFNIKDNIKVKIESISEFGDSLTLNVWENNLIENGFRLGDLVSLPAFKDINNQLVIINFREKENKYTLLDFWGTWCKPCIEGLPALKELHLKHKNRLTILSIAYDSNLNKVREFSKNNDMDWLHKFELNSELDDNLFTVQFKIECFPTFILLDRSGKVLSRGCGSDQLKIIENLIK